MSETQEAPTKKKVLTATGVALLVAVAVLMIAILPAEYGIDPLGAGEALGLTVLSKKRPISAADQEYKVDSIELDLHPGEWVEYFVRLEDGESMLFSWRASSPVNFNFHSAPDGAPRDYAETFDGGESQEAHGTYTAPFSGIHGWYWDNPGSNDLIVQLETAGYFSTIHLGRDGADGYRDVAGVRAADFRAPAE